jgi:hypothetical protein
MGTPYQSKIRDYGIAGLLYFFVLLRNPTENRFTLFLIALQELELCPQRVNSR